MNFNFFGGNMPRLDDLLYSGNSRNNVEDVDFEEVKSEPAKAQPQIDNVARYAQVSAEAMSRFESLMKEDPMSALLVSVIFKSGAKWADKHPVSEFGSVDAWKAAQRKKVTDMINGIPAEKKVDPFIVMLHHAMFAEGAQWAIETPAPTQSTDSNSKTDR